jgi:hypothetical protein
MLNLEISLAKFIKYFLLPLQLQFPNWMWKSISHIHILQLSAAVLLDKLVTHIKTV